MAYIRMIKNPGGGVRELKSKQTNQTYKKSQAVPGNN